MAMRCIGPTAIAKPKMFSDIMPVHHAPRKHDWKICDSMILEVSKGTLFVGHRGGKGSKFSKFCMNSFMKIPHSATTSQIPG